jgi:hypothetical protein
VFSNRKYKNQKGAPIHFLKGRSRIWREDRCDNCEVVICKFPTVCPHYDWTVWFLVALSTCKLNDPSVLGPSATDQTWTETLSSVSSLIDKSSDWPDLPRVCSHGGGKLYWNCFSLCTYMEIVNDYGQFCLHHLTWRAKCSHLIKSCPHQGGPIRQAWPSLSNSGVWAQFAGCFGEEGRQKKEVSNRLDTVYVAVLFSFFTV